MGAVQVDQDQPEIQSVEEMVGRFSAELICRLSSWKQQIVETPEGLASLEQTVHQEFSRGADYVIAGLLAVAMKEEEFAAAAEQARQEYVVPLRAGENRRKKVRLLGGLVIWMTTLYCAARMARCKDSDDMPGLCTELAAFGFGRGTSPALHSRVARQVAMYPSIRFARDELARDGVELDVKSVRAIADEVGRGLLALRREDVLRWRAGELPSTGELSGQRVTVQIDGGRTKIRGELKDAKKTPEKTDADGLVIEDAPGRSKPTGKRTFDSDWREPKLVTIFIHDEKGRMVKKSRATIDGTFQGPDALAEIVAMHLHRLGAADAMSVTFVADGATWIWDRIAAIVAKSGLKSVTVHEVLDNCHAAHHISLALKAYGLTEQERMPLYRELRTCLRNGQWQKVVDDLTDLSTLLAIDSNALSAMQTEIAYLQKHGQAGRLKYVFFRSIGVPLGSGAIESSIRRVINQRLKSNGIFWKEDSAESMLQLRALAISDRWDDRLQASRKRAVRDGRTTWRWDYASFRPDTAETEGSPNIS